MFNMSSIVFYIYYNSYLTFQLNTVKKFTIRLSADLHKLLVLGYLCFYKVK